MEHAIHPLAPHHLPSFITPPGETDTLLIICGVFLVVLIVLVGILYFKLHSLPERMSHGNANKAQFEIVAVLALLALFTHNNNFWFAALILAMIRFPDYASPLEVIATSVKKLASNQPPEPEPPTPPAPASDVAPAPQPREMEG